VSSYSLYKAKGLYLTGQLGRLDTSTDYLTSSARTDRDTNDLHKLDLTEAVGSSLPTVSNDHPKLLHSFSALQKDQFYRSSAPVVPEVILEPPNSLAELSSRLRVLKENRD
jgi:hypothetical protein